jgi:4-hydroxy-2-oxoglutarate aldolase
MKMNNRRISGIFPAMPTPFTQDGDLELEALRFNLRKMSEVSFSGYVIGGSSGEFVYLSDDERCEVVKVAREEVSPDRVLIVGTGMESTRATIKMTKMMADEGAEVAIVVTPNYFTSMMTSDALIHHYSSVAEASPIPILLYSVPVFTGFDLPLEAVVRLAPHPKIIGMKDSGRDIIRIGSIIHQSPAEFSMLVGSAALFLPGLSAGCVGTISALANVAGGELGMIQKEFAQGEGATARSIQMRLIKPNWTITGRFGIPGLKYALDLVGYKGGYPRSPLLPLKDEDKAEVREVLEVAGLLA